MNYIELLGKKIIPNKQHEIEIQLGPPPIAAAEKKDLESGEIDEFAEEEEEPAPVTAPAVAVRPRAPVTILDKRKTAKIDRELVVNRLKNQNMLLVKTNVFSLQPQNQDLPPPTNAPPAPQMIKIKRKLVIRKDPAAVIAPPPPEPTAAETEPLVEPPPKAARMTIKRKTKKNAVGEDIAAAPAAEIDMTRAIIGTMNISDRLPSEKQKIVAKAPTYYMNNRKLFIQKINELFAPYREELLGTNTKVTCDTQSQNTDFDLLLHQKVVRDYLNLYTPYRGLLLFHGLGAGKTCTSIAITEGMKSDKRVFVLTPASLKMNFFNEMKKCGDELYKKNQFWEFVSTEGHPEYVGILSRALSLSVDEIRKNGGAWLVNVKKAANFKTLATEEQNDIDAQINMMIRNKYTDINYNGLNMKKVDILTENKTKNPFDNSVVVIDEAHNFVSRIVNKIKKPKSISYILYDYLMKATNAKIVLLSGTPIINYPNEIGILYNILRGYIRTWTMNITVKTAAKVNTESILAMLETANLKTYDYVEYSGNILTITRNPLGFVNVKKRGVAKGTKRPAKGGGQKTKKLKLDLKPDPKAKTRQTTRKIPIAQRLSTDDDQPEIDEETAKAYRQAEHEMYEGGGTTEVSDKYNGVHLNETGNISDDVFISAVTDILKKNGLEINKTETTLLKSLPDDPESFLSTFVNTDTAEAKNINLFQRRILGLTSYFRSAQEELLPRYVRTGDDGHSGDIYHIIKTPMSQHQFSIYSKIRKEEADREKKAKAQKRMQQAAAGEEIYNISSTYRIFSRAACNFVFPEGIVRPVPKPKPAADDETAEEGAAEINELDFDLVPKTQRQDADIYSELGEEPTDAVLPEDDATVTYASRIEHAMADVDAKTEDGTAKYLDKSVIEELSPKLMRVLENMQNEENTGLHLLYSHFRTIEGIGILRLILLANGFAEFKIRKTDSSWEIDETDEDAEKPRFVLYTGTETTEEKEILINVYNGAWGFVPSNISAKLKEKNYENNILGQVIKIFMITSSGAEGINLRNTRFVHILEPYWHMVRIEQVVGRARRICSHQDLPEDMRTVKVFLYITTLSNEQKKDEGNIELRIRDVSRLDKETPVTTDETLYEIATMKQRINNQILRAVKETAVDCNLYSAAKNKGVNNGDISSEPQVCYGFGKIQSNQFGSYPSFEKDSEEKEGLDLRAITWRAQKITINGVFYALNPKTNEVYDFESYKRAIDNKNSDLVLVGNIKDGKFVKI
jgi:hypothetical protein